MSENKKARIYWVEDYVINDPEPKIGWAFGYDGNDKDNILIPVVTEDAYKSLESEIEYLKRMLADERSGDCDKDKTIRRLESKIKALEEKLEKCLNVIDKADLLAEEANYSIQLKEVPDLEYLENYLSARQTLAEITKVDE